MDKGETLRKGTNWCTTGQGGERRGVTKAERSKEEESGTDGAASNKVGKAQKFIK